MTNLCGASFCFEYLFSFSLFVGTNGDLLLLIIRVDCARGNRNDCCTALHRIDLKIIKVPSPTPKFCKQNRPLLSPTTTTTTTTTMYEYSSLQRTNSRQRKKRGTGVQVNTPPSLPTNLPKPLNPSFLHLCWGFVLVLDTRGSQEGKEKEKINKKKRKGYYI